MTTHQRLLKNVPRKHREDGEGQQAARQVPSNRPRSRCRRNDVWPFCFVPDRHSSSETTPVPSKLPSATQNSCDVKMLLPVRLARTSRLSFHNARGSCRGR